MCFLLFFVFFLIVLFDSAESFAVQSQAKPKFMPYHLLVANETKDDPNYPNGRPNKYYSDVAIKYKIDTLILAFLILTPDRKAGWFNGTNPPPMVWAKPFAQELVAGGVKIAVSFGGALGHDISYVMTVDELVNTYQSVIDQLNATHLDFDFENGYYNAEKAFKAMVKIMAANPNLTMSLTVATNPYGMPEKIFAMVRLAKSLGLNLKINIMTMNFGRKETDMGTLCAKAVFSFKKQLATLYPNLSDDQLYAKITAIPMIGMNDIKSEIFKFKDVELLTKFACKTGFDLSMWALSRDKPVLSGDPEQTSPFEFTSNFMKGLSCQKP